MKKMNGWLRITAAALMSLTLLAGCGSGGEKEPTQNTQTVTKESDAGAQPGKADGIQGSSSSGIAKSTEGTTGSGASGILATEKLENPNVTIAAYWDFTDASSPQYNEQYVAAIQEFEEKYGGSVTVNAVGWNKGAAAIQEAMATDTLFDLVFTEGNARFPGDAVDKLYQPIDQWLDYEVFDKGSVDAFLYRGEHYVFTNYAITAPYLIIYNKTIFEEEGLENPTELFDRGEWTYDKFLEYMEYFTRDTDGDGEIDQWGLGPRFKRQNFGFANGAMPVYEVGDGTLAVGIDSQECIQYYEFLSRFGRIDTKCPGDAGWLESRMCVMFSEAGPSAGLSKDGTSTDEFDFVPLPTFDGRLATSPVWDNGFAMVNGAPNPEGAAVLMTMMGRNMLGAYDENLKAQYSEEQVERYLAIMEKIVPQRRNYPGVSNGVGESEALAGTPAQTIIETYKSQLEGEVSAYNAALQ